LLRPPGIDFKASEPPPKQKQQLGHLPTGAKERSVHTVEEKYVIGETYSGQNDFEIRKKVWDLEEKITKMISRRARFGQNCNTCTDVTSLVGAAILASSCGSRERKTAVAGFNQTILSTMDPKETPNLWRLAQAHRLFLVVLSQSESPVTSASRETHRLIEGIALTQEYLAGQLDEIAKAIKKKI
jgi:hypothetical protein